MTDASTIWARLAQCVAVLDEPFRASEIVGWFRRHYPEVNEASLRAHIQSATSNVSDSSKIAGFAARSPLVTRLHHGVYVRFHRPTPSDAHAEPGVDSTVDADVFLIGCSAAKNGSPALARELFTGDRFRKAPMLAEASGRPWYVLSAKWGLLHPDDVVGPYNVFLADQPADYRSAWGNWVAAQLLSAEGNLGGRVVEIHAGQAYVHPLRGPLGSRGARISEPLKSLRQGEQLSWYAKNHAGRGPTRDSASQDEPADGVGAASAERTSSREADPKLLGGFDYRWPDAVEHFEQGWEVTVADAGRTWHVKHGVGSREVYARDRRHSVTFLDGQPVVEGVAADDYVDSGCLLSALKDADGKLIRVPEDVPSAYAGLPLVNHRSEIDAPYSPDAVAVKLAEDDVLGWATYAIARAKVRSAKGSPSAAAAVTTPTMALPVGGLAGTRAEVVQALLGYGRSRQSSEPQGEPSFTPLAEANRLILDDPFAFLLAVIFDQGIPAERAWRAPYDLRLRLGHLDPLRMSQEEAQVRTAIGTVPKLHRYIDKMPGWLVRAARMVVDDYQGDAGAIWRGTPSAREVFRRLDAFPGIGQKKAAMAVEILERDLGVPLADMHGSDIAYDVHVRRVFLRTGLAERDDLDHMVQIAREAHPDRPGEIDLPAWLVGRNWCHAGVPECALCVLREVCPKNVAAAATVSGA